MTNFLKEKFKNNEKFVFRKLNYKIYTQTYAAQNNELNENYTKQHFFLCLNLIHFHHK